MAIALSVKQHENAFTRKSRVLSDSGVNGTSRLNHIYSKKQLTEYMNGRKERLFSAMDELDEQEEKKSTYRLTGNHDGDLHIQRDEEDGFFYDGGKYDILNRSKAECKVLQDEINWCRTALGKN
jgi:hypothetical protein